MELLLAPIKSKLANDIAVLKLEAKSSKENISKQNKIVVDALASALKAKNANKKESEDAIKRNKEERKAHIQTKLDDDIKELKTTFKIEKDRMIRARVGILDDKGNDEVASVASSANDDDDYNL